MSTYLSPLFYKARTDIDRLVRKHDGISAASYGLYHALMAISKTDLTDGKLDLAEVAKMASSLRLKTWKSALQGLLEAGLITEVTDTYIQLDWTGQTTREAIEKRSVTRPDGTHDVAKMHENGDHTYCRKPHCDKATKWAKGYDENGGKRVTRKVTGKGTKGNPTGDHPPVPQSQSQIQRQKDSGYESDEAAAPTLTPGGDAPYSPPGKDTPPVDDDEPLRPRTPIAEIDFENFDLHDVTARTQVSLYEVDDDGGCEVYTVLHRTEEVLSCDPSSPLYAQILAKVPERLAWIGEAIESKLTAAGCRFDAVTCFAEDPMDDWTITVEWCRVADRVKLVEIVEEALQNAGLFPVADE